MNIIDHRILIPAAPEAIWTVVGNIQRLPEWQVNCKNVTLLTSPQAHPGPGMRWRYTPNRGNDLVIMVTAWYDRLGYEYTFVDGSSLKATKGQIRLQETAEGTIVQWTFQYESTGMLSGIRGTRRTIENDIVESLRELYRLLVRDRNAQYKQSRSSVREAPDVSQRAQYKTSAKVATDEHTAVNNVEEDTRPRGVDLEQSAHRSDEATTPQADSIFAPPANYTPDTTVDAPISKQEHLIPAPPPPIELPDESPPDTAAPDSTIRDTSQISIFELFGLPRPSDTQEIRRDTVEQAVAEEQNTIAELDQPNMAAPIQGALRVGLRGQLRRQYRNLRV